MCLPRQRPEAVQARGIQQRVGMNELWGGEVQVKNDPRFPE